MKKSFQLANTEFVRTEQKDIYKVQYNNKVCANIDFECVSNKNIQNHIKSHASKENTHSFVSITKTLLVFRIELHVDYYYCCCWYTSSNFQFRSSLLITPSPQRCRSPTWKRNCVKLKSSLKVSGGTGSR